MEPLQWRKRIGLITNSGQVITEPRYYQLAPAGVTFHASRMLNTGGSDGLLLKERSKLLVILAPPSDDGMRLIDEISEEYERRFDQESVLRVVYDTCVSFS